MKLSGVRFHSTVIFTVKSMPILNLCLSFTVANNEVVTLLLWLYIRASVALAIGRLRLPFIMV